MACAAGSFEVGLHWRRSLEGEAQEVSKSVQFEMVPKCRIFVSVASIADVFFEGRNALHVTARFARPRVIFVVAQPSNHRGLRSAHHG